MSKNFSKKLAAEYVVYMNGGSAFGKCRRLSPIAENRLYAHYAAMSQKQQRAMEKAVDRMVYACSTKAVKKAWAGLHAECRVRELPDGGVEMRFVTGGFEGMIALIDGEGNITIEATPAK